MSVPKPESDFVIKPLYSTRTGELFMTIVSATGGKELRDAFRGLPFVTNAFQGTGDRFEVYFSARYSAQECLAYLEDWLARWFMPDAFTDAIDELDMNDSEAGQTG